MNRSDAALRIISAGPTDSASVRRNDSPAFAGQYPGGFAPITKVAEGDYLDFSPDHVAMIGTDLSDRQFERLCQAIRCYQQATIVNFAIQLPPDLIVQAFADDQPDNATVLAVTAHRFRMPLVRFLGADRGTGIHS